MNELQHQFVIDAEELVENLFRALQQLRARQPVGRFRRQLTGQIFRQVHTLKGAAGAAEKESISRLAHEFESVLHGVRLGRIGIDDAVLDTFEDAAHAISEMLHTPDHGEAASASGALLDRLRKIAASGTPEGLRPIIYSRPLLPPDMARSLSEYDEHHLREAVEEGARVFIVSTDFPLTTFDEEFRDLSEQLAANGEVLATIPATQSASQGKINFRILYATTLDAQGILAQMGSPDDVTIAEMPFKRSGDAIDLAEQSATSLPRIAGTLEITPSAAGNVRVNLAELDDLIARANELFRDTTNALELAAAKSGVGANLTEAESGLGRIQQQFLELEDRLIKLRMVPLAQTFERAARAGRVAARATGKLVTFEISGGEVSIDKSLADAIADPLMHLVRNAVDHGIELPDQRAAAGKNNRGCVRLGATAESNRIELYVEDDGRGVDSEEVARAAAEREIVADPSGVTMEQCLRLIFRPGFSTSPAVSHTSGRGIGLEIVDRAMEEVGGEVHVRTEPGQGSTFQMILPATLALVTSVLVRAGMNMYCIDARHVVDMGVLETKGMTAGEKIVWRDKDVPLVSLSELLGHMNGASDGIEGAPMSFLVIRLPSPGEVAVPGKRNTDQSANEHLSLAVNTIEGKHQALVRSLGRHAARWRGVAGATELRDGTVALVLDLAQLLEAFSETETRQ
ncbi:MAG: ATP-binding protein [Pyrinomonadaceae bacterium]